MITDRTNILELPVREAISYVFDDFRLDIKRQELQKAGSPVPLTHKAYRVLLILVQNSEQTVEKEFIYKELWGDSFVEDANLTQHIYILRKNLGQNSKGESYIETVSRTGYRFTVPVRAVYPPQVAEAVFKPKTGAEPAPELHTRPRVEPHLKLAETSAAEQPISDEQAHPSPPAKVSPFTTKQIVAAAVIAALAIAAIALVWLFRSTSAPGTNARIRSVAVLPFKPIGEESRNERLGLGMADAIITNLTKIRQIPVRPTSSVIRYVDQPDRNSLAAGTELGVDTVLEGTVQMANERVRVSVQLIDVSDGHPIWADNFDEPSRDIFEVQDSISQKVARSLAANLTQGDRSESRGGTTTNLEAMKAYQLGVYLHSTRTKENLFKAEEYFKDAVAKDPQFAKAYAMLADTYNMQRYYRYADPLYTRAKGLDAASRSLELDSSTPEAYIAMANLQVGGKEGIAGSKRLLEKAIELSPYNATARLRYAWVISGEDLKAASEQMRLAQEYDPVSPITNGAYCNMLIFERRFKDAIPFCEKAVDLNPTSNNSHGMLADVYLFDGRVDDAIAKVNERIARTEGQDRLAAEGSLAFYLLKSGRRGEADAIIERLKREADKVPEVLGDLTILMYEIGDREAGLQYFKRAYHQRILNFAMLDHYPVWEKVKADPEVQRILAEPRLPAQGPSPSPNR